ncbi:MAG: HAMP domain-containing histidine kinase, partial [Gemmatimonadetes bacterium]|nr:HAMP domain-containing histidine kinase [Gemmatimonadota bacterium]
MLDRIRRRFASENAPATLVLGVLVATLALSGVLVHQAARAVRSQRAAAEGALRDYAAFAAWELGRRAEGEIARVVGLAVARGRADAEMRNTIAMRMLRDLVASRAVTRAKATIAMLTSPAARAPADALVAFAAAVRAELERFGAPGAASAFFRVDLTTGAVEMLDGELPDAVRQALVDTLRARASRSADPARLALPVVLPLRGLIRTRSDTLRTVEVRTIVAEAPIAVVAAAGQPHSHVASSIVRALAGDTAEAFGFVVDIPAVARPVLRRIVDGAPLLPPSLTRGAPNAAVLAIDVRTRAGRPVLATGRLADAPVASDTLDGALSQLVARVAVRRDIADRLVIGGLPRSRLPLLAGLFALALGLTGVAVMQLRRQQQFARLRSDFVAGISHELRTPLAQIRLFSDLLESGRLDRAGAERSVRIIGEEARRLTYLVENVLRFSRAERSGDRIAPAPRQLAPLVREVADAFAPLARSADVALVTQLDPDIVAAVDADALRQILLNLLDNAVKYGPRGQRVTLGLARDGDFARLWVDDEGPGIPPADRARVWEPYRRLDRDIDRVTGGSGIGLAVVRSLVRLHGGDVAIADSPAGGARVVVRLPA